ncbi:hypothetical protein SAMN05444362_104187 [Dysgonomonas macrotermitis]|uniref:Uncharacterized protein n=1 Tax=Dysgonomonas macrotermitis TaxID=1346286 RepID=A0A1M4ZTL9_9BACT|nr:hypothetical protein SAMN05444362_104187 [Dysgonomonas macrotermitis]
MVFSQEVREARTLADNPINSKFPLLKFLDVEYEQFSAADYKLKRDDQKYEDGSIHSQKRLRASVMVPVLMKKKFVVFTSLRYKYEVLDYENVKYYLIDKPFFTHKANEESHYLAGTVSFNYIDRIFGKRLLVNGNVTVDGSDRGYERMMGSVSALINIRESAHTTFAIGAYVSSSRSLVFPIFPTLRYQHMFVGTPWMIDGIMPQYFYARRMIGENGRFSFGFLLDSGMFFEYPGQEGFKHVYTFDKVAGKLDLVYEHNLTKSIMLRASGGLSKTYKGVFREKNKKDDFAEMSQDWNGYFSLGVSYNLGRRK